MPKIKYESLNLAPKTLKVIEQANAIIDVYRAQGYDLTLRQLYYQFVSRDLLANTAKNYNRLGDIISKGRRAGLVDWSAIVDRTRELSELSSWDSPRDILDAVAQQFRLDLWEGQENYVEVWFEKDALMGVFERAANPLRVPFFSCRGYTSDSSVWAAAQRLARRTRGAQRVTILHFGDHDPSGLDMTRDIGERLRLFGASRVTVNRLALNMDQVEQYDPPPNPAKESDSRFAEYQAEYGDESWELDALEPTVLAKLVRDEVRGLVDVEEWNAQREKEAICRAELRLASENWTAVVETHCGEASTGFELDDDTSLDLDEDEDEDE